MDSTPRRTVQLDARNLRGVAHPVRVRMLGLLRSDGPATATSLARRLGLNTGATSYHLRQLAAHGFVVEDPDRGTGRERWWRAAHQSTQLDRAELGPDEDGLAGEFLRAISEVYTDSMRRSVEELPTLPREWYEAAVFSDYVLHLTPEELRRLRAEVAEVAGRYRPVDASAAPPEGTAEVIFQFQAFPRPGVLEPPDREPPETGL